MGTHSRIGIVNEDQTITSIYCHFDGYPERVGATLLEHWTDPSKVGQLMQLGDISSLQEEVGEKHDLEWRSPYFGFDAKPRSEMDADPRSKWTRAYGRDQGDPDTEAVTSPSLEAFRLLADDCSAAYTYLFIDGQWNCWDGQHRKVYLKVEA